ncbi:EutP/PduV family microcompartment system protein [Endozoicomonas ascidiicola]|uniref:EutP/PduV family microcompartment system protein n=1 Tax=Endozoicomonas ascidiicola TaxID=1698521 RepID=UPI00082A673A|nr:EutP/PduV family microcompartment system protein [Endozoicomonas ascidiicola]
MKKMMLVGTTTAGKTTLVQALMGEELRYQKTQAMTYNKQFLDTPGEFIENRRFYSALMSSSVDYDAIAVLHDCSKRQNLIPPGFATMFNKEVIGIMTKVDSEKANREFSRKMLTAAKVSRIFEISSYTGEGMDELKAWLES